MLMERQGNFLEPMAKFYLAQIILAVGHLHSLGEIQFKAIEVPLTFILKVLFIEI